MHHTQCNVKFTLQYHDHASCEVIYVAHTAGAFYMQAGGPGTEQYESVQAEVQLEGGESAPSAALHTWRH
jgi:hypothetical protein